MLHGVCGASRSLKLRYFADIRCVTNQITYQLFLTSPGINSSTLALYTHATDEGTRETHDTALNLHGLRTPERHTTARQRAHRASEGRSCTAARTRVSGAPRAPWDSCSGYLARLLWAGRLAQVSALATAEQLRGPGAATGGCAGRRERQRVGLRPPLVAHAYRHALAAPSNWHGRPRSPAGLR